MASDQCTEASPLAPGKELTVSLSYRLEHSRRISCLNAIARFPCSRAKFSTSWRSKNQLAQGLRRPRCRPNSNRHLLFPEGMSRKGLNAEPRPHPRPMDASLSLVFGRPPATYYMCSAPTPRTAAPEAKQHAPSWLSSARKPVGRGRSGGMVNFLPRALHLGAGPGFAQALWYARLARLVR